MSIKALLLSLTTMMSTTSNATNLPDVMLHVRLDQYVCPDAHSALNQCKVIGQSDKVSTFVFSEVPGGRLFFSEEVLPLSIEGQLGVEAGIVLINAVGDDGYKSITVSTRDEAHPERDTLTSLYLEDFLNFRAIVLTSFKTKIEGGYYKAILSINPK